MWWDSVFFALYIPNFLAVLAVATVLEGDMEFEVQGRMHHPQAGDELLIPARAVHSARNIGSKTAHWLYGYGGRQGSARKVKAGSR